MIGEIAALSGALAWALSSIFFAEIGVQVRAVNLNVIKGLLAGLMMLMTLTLGTVFGSSSLSLQSVITIRSTEFGLLVLSGIIGIGIGDSAYFGCLRRIGPQKGLMLEATAPVMAAVLALLLFNEYLTHTGWLGIMLTTAGVIVVVYLSHSQEGYHNSLSGISLGLFAAVSQATGIVLSRMALAGGQIEPLASSLIRLTAGLVAMGCYIGVKQKLSKPHPEQQSLTDAWRLITKHQMSRKLFFAVFIGTFIALWLQQLSVKYTSAGIAQTLMATCPLFGMLLGVFQGQKQPGAVWMGLLLGITGVSLLFIL